jgi:hypothetical protein
MQPENKYKAEDQFRREFFPDRKQYKNRFINPLEANPLLPQLNAARK